MMNVKEKMMEAFYFRYACKEFDPDTKISQEDFQFILEAGRLSPSSFGFEPWKFVVLQNMPIRERIREVAWGGQRQLPTASHLIVVLSRKAVDTKAGSEYITRLMFEMQNLPEDVAAIKGDFFKSFQENDFDLTDERKLFDWANKQAYIAMGNMMTSAAMLGIDSCPMEGFRREGVEKILAEEGVMDSEHFGVCAMLAFGYRAKNTSIHEKTRGRTEDVTQWVE